MFRVAGGVFVLLLLALFAYVFLRGDNGVSAETPYDGVHLCAPDQQEAVTVEAQLYTPALEVDTGGDGPLFAQNDPRWGNEEYDSAASQDVGCGTTLAQCGCAMTSVATVMRLLAVISTPDGADLNPSTLNAWFNQGATMTNAGWISQGYVFGNVVWPAINGWKPDHLSGATDTSTERDPEASATPSAGATPAAPEGVRFVGWGSGSEDEIRSELKAGRPVVLEVPGHYIAAVGLEGDTIRINDPYYSERTTLSSYKGRILSSRLFQPSSDFRMLMVDVPANLRLQVTDEQGRTVGTLGGSDPGDAEDEAKSDIPGSQYHFESAWRDPTCTERPPKPGSGVNTVFIALPESGTYKVVVVNPSGGKTAAAVHMTNVKGEQQTQSHEGGKRLEFEIHYDSGISGPVTPTITPVPPITAFPPVTLQPPVTVEPPTVTNEPPTVTVAPATLSISITQGEGVQVMPGQRIEACFTASNSTTVELDAVAPDGSRTPLLQGQDADQTKRCIPVLIEGGDPPGKWMLELVGTGGATATTFFNVVPPASTIESFTATLGQCSSGSNNVDLSWLVTGDPMAKVAISREHVGATTEQVYAGAAGEGIGSTRTLEDQPPAGTYTYTLTATASNGQAVTARVTIRVLECS